MHGIAPGMEAQTVSKDRFALFTGIQAIHSLCSRSTIKSGG